MDILVLSTLATAALAIMSMSLQAEIISAFWLGGSAVARRFLDSDRSGRWATMDGNQSADASCADLPYERCSSSDDGGAGCDSEQDGGEQGWISSCSSVWGGRWCSPEEAFLGWAGKGRDGQDWEAMIGSFWWRQRFIQVRRSQVLSRGGRGDDYRGYRLCVLFLVLFPPLLFINTSPSPGITSEIDMVQQMTMLAAIG